MNNDTDMITKLYEAVKTGINDEGEGRFKGLRPEIVSAIRSAEEKVKWAIKDIENTDRFFVQRLYTMIPENSDDMIDYDPTINPATGFPNKTMYTDGKHFYYNPAFVNLLSPKEAEAVVIHELLHVALGHHLSFSDVPKNRPDLWRLVNIAGDLAINQLIQDRTGFMREMLLPGRPPFTNLPPNLDARQYFNILLKSYTENPPPPTPTNPEPKEGGDTGGEQGDEGDEGGEQGEQGGEGEEGGETGGEGGEQGEQGGEGEEGGETGEQGGDTGGEGGEQGEQGGDTGGTSGTGTGGQPKEATYKVGDVVVDHDTGDHFVVTKVSPDKTNVSVRPATHSEIMKAKGI